VGVPIESKGELFGNLYLANKLPNSQNADDRVDVFLESDRQLLEKFATQGAIAIENAQLYRKTQELAVLQERERFSMDLHDGIMQSVYGTGLSLQEVKIQMGSGQPEVTTRVEGAIGDLSQVLRDIRNYIMGLRPGRFQEQNIVTGINEIALELRANTLLNVQVESLLAEEFEPWDGEDTAELLFITQEALTNIRKHSHARNVAIQLTRDQQQLVIKIKDDGIGFDPDLLEKSQGQGLHNMRERARNVGATIEILPSRGEGTLIKLLLPVPDAVDE
jgi:signal transduction histidine kinase